LDKIKVYFCDSYEDKVKIATKCNVDVMIDDKIKVLNCFGDQTKKIWLCDDDKKITGANKYQPDLLEKLKVARQWHDILVYLEPI
jgi:hypothetical protein